MRLGKITKTIISATAFVAAASAAHAANYIAIDLTPPTFSSAEIASVVKTPFMYENPYVAGAPRLLGSGMRADDQAAHALLWTGSDNHAVDLNPTGFSWSVILAGDANIGHLVGGGGGAGQDSERPLALLWDSNAPYKLTNMTPAGFTWAQVYDLDAAGQVGWGVPANGNQPHALMWNDTAASVQDLNPQGSVGSGAYAIAGVDVVGMYIPTASQWDQRHATIWYGLFGRATNGKHAMELNPAGFVMSEADGIYESEEINDLARAIASASALVVGMGMQKGSKFAHALFWPHPPELVEAEPLVIDLNPAGFDSSKAVAVTPTQQAGWGSPTGSTHTHALVWHGTAASCVDLQQFLPVGFTDSVATCIDANGNVYGSATDASGRNHAIEWKAFPETDGEPGNAVNTK
jgi:hypothetical protein